MTTAMKKPELNVIVRDKSNKGRNILYVITLVLFRVEIPKKYKQVY